MEYNITFSIVKNGALIGVEHINESAETLEELRDIIIDYIETHETKRIVYLLDYVMDIDGNEYELNIA